MDSDNVNVVQAGTLSLGRPKLSVLWYSSLTPPSVYPTLVPTVPVKIERARSPSQETLARGTTLTDSTNRVRLATQVSSQATLAVVSLFWLAPVVYSAGNGSMGSMTVWKYGKYGRPNELSIHPTGETQGPGLARCELIDSQLYQQQYEKYGFCDDHKFLGGIFKT